MELREIVMLAMARVNYPGGTDADIAEMADGWANEADAAIAVVLDAMEEPSEGMVFAGMTARVDHPERDNTLSRHERLTAGIYKAMLAAFRRDYFLSALAEADGDMIDLPPDSRGGR